MSITRWTAVAALVFALCFVVGMLLPGNTPSGDDPDQTIVDYYNDSGHQTMLIVAVYLEAIAAISLVAFATLAFGDDSGSPLIAVARASAYLAAAAIAIGTVALASVGAGAAIDNAPIDAGTARFLPSVGYGTILLVGGLAASAMMAAVSLYWLRTRAMAAWLSWFGFVCAFACLFGIVFIPMIALPLWALVVGIVLLSKGAGAMSMAVQPSAG